MWSFFYDSRHKRADFTIVARFGLNFCGLGGNNWAKWMDYRS